jgi:Uma2 family endonuclease
LTNSSVCILSLRYHECRTTGTQLLTPEEFERLYAHQDTAYEYWFGEAVPKAMPSILHGITQQMTSFLLLELGYYTGVEVDLHIHPQWCPRPDVLVSTRKLERPYPTRSDDLFVVEVLSPDDSWSYVYKKCENYQHLTGIETVFLLDPEIRKGWQWSPALQNAERIDELVLPHGDTLPLTKIWERVDLQV